MHFENFVLNLAGFIEARRANLVVSEAETLQTLKYSFERAVEDAVIEALKGQRIDLKEALVGAVATRLNPGGRLF